MMMMVMKQNGENFFFLVQMFCSPMGYLASIMFLMPRQYFYLVSKYLNRSITVNRRVIYMYHCLESTLKEKLSRA